MMAIGSMQAVRLHGREDLRVEEVSIPIAEEHEVQLRVAFTGICGTDLHLYDGWELRGAVTYRRCRRSSATNYRQSLKRWGRE